MYFAFYFKTVEFPKYFDWSTVAHQKVMLSFARCQLSTERRMVMTHKRGFQQEHWKGCFSLY